MGKLVFEERREATDGILIGRGRWQAGGGIVLLCWEAFPFSGDIWDWID